MIRWAVAHFVDFHTGTVNVVLHVIGFAGLFYSIHRLDWRLFVTFLVIVELGHVYNHVAGIKPYDTRPLIVLWRMSAFTAVVTTAHFIQLFA